MQHDNSTMSSTRFYAADICRRVCLSYLLFLRFSKLCS
ncbi:unnamed protein product [Brugia timori]|uniref:Uncharacterized protein n=1 Tax=Brugia timori TaxID=42155 RepID=A0A0R3QWT5_9BILA|nr:unnamed protein product [Brugia timori]